MSAAASAQALLAAAGPLTFAFMASSTAHDGTSITLPGSLQAGDVAIIVEAGFSGSATVPAGWTQAEHEADPGNAVRLQVVYKKLTGSESVVSMSTGSSSELFRVAMIFRPNRSFTTLTAGSWSANYDTGGPSNRSISASGQLAPLIAFGAKFLDGAQNPSMASSPTDFTAGTTINGSILNEGLRLEYLIYNPGTAPQNLTVSTTDQGGPQILAAGYLRIAE